MEIYLKKLFSQLTLALVATLSSAGAALAADAIRVVGTAGATYGGDDWQVATSSSGTPLVIRGGRGYTVGAGVSWQSAAYPVMATLVANYHVDPSAGRNTSAKFKRAPIDAMVYYTGLETLRFGVGLSYIVAPTVKATVDGQSETIKFKNALGQSFEIGYELAPDLWTNLRLSSEKFKPKTGSSATQSKVSQLSINLSYLF